MKKLSEEYFEKFKIVRDGERPCLYQMRVEQYGLIRELEGKIEVLKNIGGYTIEIDFIQKQLDQIRKEEGL